MSGTSADAVDAALVRIPGPRHAIDLVAFASEPIPAELRDRIRDASRAPLELRELLRLDRILGELLGEAALAVLRRAGVDPREVAGIGSHGQTIAHHPEPEVCGSLQIGSAAVIHEITGIPVISDFRAADLAAGGQGAPLTPFLHRAVFSHDHEIRAVLNIGGFTNVTFLPAAGAQPLIAFDPGPGNALLDRAARWASGGEESFDVDGRRCQEGRADPQVLEDLLSDPYFAMAPPKSTGHERFGAAFFERAKQAVLARGGSPDDLLATLARLTVESVVRAAASFFPRLPERWVVYGGGVHNRALMEGLTRWLSPALVERSDAQGIPADALEAIAFALLGHAASLGEPGNVPSATGARRAAVLGTQVPPGHRFESR